MRFFEVLLIVSIIGQSEAQVCTDNWHLVSLAEGHVCWKLFDVPDFSTDYTGAFNLCEATKSIGAEVRNTAEKAILADISSRSMEPTLSCYKAFQSSVTSQFKSVDYEKPPEYLVRLNEQGNVQLKRGIRKGDRVSVTFSIGSFNKTGKILEGSLKVGKSIELIFGVDSEGKRFCKFKHDGVNEFSRIELKDEQFLVSDEYFGVLTLDFLDKRISFLDTHLDIPKNYSYTGSTDISIKNLIVSSIQHSKVCPGIGSYHFERKNTPFESSDVKNGHFRVNLFFETASTISVPSSFYDFYKTSATDKNSENKIAFEVKIAGADWSKAKVLFKWKGKTVLQCSLAVDTSSYWGLTLSGLNENDAMKTMKSDVANPQGRASVRLTITSDSNTMIVQPSISSLTEHKTLPDTLEAAYYHFDEISMSADNASFYDVQMTWESEVVVQTCNFRPYQFEDNEQAVPYQEKCIKKRNILCQRKPQNDSEEDSKPLEQRELIDWKEGMKPDIEELDLKEDEKEEVAAESGIVEESVRIENIEEFRWCVIGLSSISLVSFFAIFLLS